MISCLDPTVARGHHVTTVRYRMEQDMPLPHLGDNLEEVTISVNNTDGTVPFVSQVSTALGIRGVTIPLSTGSGIRIWNPQQAENMTPDPDPGPESLRFSTDLNPDPL